MFSFIFRRVEAVAFQGLSFPLSLFCFSGFVFFPSLFWFSGFVFFPSLFWFSGFVFFPSLFCFSGFVFSPFNFWYAARGVVPSFFALASAVAGRAFELDECCFTSTETVGLLGTGNPGRPPRLSHSSDL